MCAVRVERICARTQELARPAPLAPVPPRVRARVGPACTHTEPGTRPLVSTQSRVVINFNKTLGVRRDRALREEEEGEGAAERERERESRFDTTHIRSLRMHTSTLDCTLVPCNKIL